MFLHYFTQIYAETEDRIYFLNGCKVLRNHQPRFVSEVNWKITLKDLFCVPNSFF